MRDYEMTLIFDPDLEEKEEKALLQKIKKWFEKEKGKLEKEEIWGKRKLAYAISKKQEGRYVFWLLKIKQSCLPEIEKKLKLEEKILRYLLIKRD